MQTTHSQQTHLAVIKPKSKVQLRLDSKQHHLKEDPLLYCMEHDSQIKLFCTKVDCEDNIYICQKCIQNLSSLDHLNGHSNHLKTTREFWAEILNDKSNKLDWQFSQPRTIPTVSLQILQNALKDIARKIIFSFVQKQSTMINEQIKQHRKGYQDIKALLQHDRISNSNLQNRFFGILYQSQAWEHIERELLSIVEFKHEMLEQSVAWRNYLNCCIKSIAKNQVSLLNSDWHAQTYRQRLKFNDLCPIQSEIFDDGLVQLKWGNNSLNVMPHTLCVHTFSSSNFADIKRLGLLRFEGLRLCFDSLHIVGLPYFVYQTVTQIELCFNGCTLSDQWSTDLYRNFQDSLALIRKFKVGFINCKIQQIGSFLKVLNLLDRCESLGLDFKNSYFENGSVPSLAQILLNLQSLHSLSLSFNQLNVPQQYELLFKNLSNLAYLKQLRLQLAGQQLNVESLKILMTSIGTQDQLGYLGLDLSSNPNLTDSTIAQLLQSVKKLPLRFFNLKLNFLNLTERLIQQMFFSIAKIRGLFKFTMEFKNVFNDRATVNWFRDQCNKAMQGTMILYDLIFQ